MSRIEIGLINPGTLHRRTIRCRHHWWRCRKTCSPPIVVDLKKGKKKSHCTLVYRRCRPCKIWTQSQSRLEINERINQCVFSLLCRVCVARQTLSHTVHFANSLRFKLLMAGCGYVWAALKLYGVLYMSYSSRLSSTLVTTAVFVPVRGRSHSSVSVRHDFRPRTGW